MNSALLKQQQESLVRVLKNKCIMVSGATGLVGSSIVRLLEDLNFTFQAGIKVIALCRNKEKYCKVFPKASNCLEFEYWDAATDLPIINDRVDYVIHCSGCSGGTKMHLSDPVKVFDINVNGTRRMLDWCAKTNAAFLYVSSYEIYGEISQEVAFDETVSCQLDTFSLRNIYAECKRMCEALCCAYSSKHSISTFSVRLTSTFGLGVAYDDPRFFAEFARCVIEGRDIVLKSKGETVRSYLDADDAAMAMLFVLVFGKSGNAYNLTNMDNAISIRDLAHRMIEVSESGIMVKYDIENDYAKFGFRKEGCTLMDCRKLLSLGWNPVYTLDETLKKLVDGMRGKSRIMNE